VCSKITYTCVHFLVWAIYERVVCLNMIDDMCVS